MEHTRGKDWYKANINDSLSGVEDTVVLCAIDNIVASLVKSNNYDSVLFLDKFVQDYVKTWG